MDASPGAAAQDRAYNLLEYLMYADTPNIHLPDKEIDEDFNRRLASVLDNSLCKEVDALRDYITYWAGFKEVSLSLQAPYALLSPLSSNPSLSEMSFEAMSG